MTTTATSTSTATTTTTTVATTAALLFRQHLIASVLWTAQKARLIKDYVLDYDGGFWNDLLIEAYSPRYDSPESGLPRFARWKSNGTWFFKVGELTVLVEI